MQILLITQEPPLRSDEIVTGGAVRTAQLNRALQHAGHVTSQTWLQTANGSTAGTFRNQDELRAEIISKAPDVILVGYWELMELLPFEPEPPVIVDFVAPRPLEVLYERPERVVAELDRLQRALTKADLLLTGNTSQRELLWFTMMQAGFDLRKNQPSLVVPLAAEPAGTPESDPDKDGWTLVSGGFNWPWRKSDEYWQAIQSMQGRAENKAPRLVLFGSQDQWRAQSPDHAGSGHQAHSLSPYSHFSKFLLEHAHVGLEVAETNIERQHSQSFRSLEFLRHGLPLICNDYLPIARLVRDHRAGWTVAGPGDLAGLVEDIMHDPGEWRNRSENALQLVTDVLSPVKVAEPLLEWLESPEKAKRLPRQQFRGVEPVLGTPPWPQRLIRQARLIRRVVLRWVFRSTPGDDILIVTRSDLFPDDHGAAVKIVETARGLSLHGRRVGIVSDDRKTWWLFENGRKSSRRLPFWLRFLHLPGPLARLLHMSKDIPESNSFLYLPLTDSSFFWHCLYIGKKLDAGILQAEFPAYAQPCIEAREILDAPVTLVEHNVEYERLRAQVNDLSTDQYQKLKAIEVDLCNRSDAVICVSDNDRQKLLNDGVKPTLLNTIPHGFDPAPFESPAKADPRKTFSLPQDAVLIAFHGTFAYPPNRDALRVFAEILLPLLESANHPYHVIAIGRKPPTHSLHPNIHLTGSVSAVAPWLKACDLAVIPLREGGGTRMKIVDCFAAGLPVVSTSKGIEGIPVVNGREAVICDDWVVMAREIVTLTTSTERRRKLVANASEFALNLGWKRIAQRYLELFATIRRAAR